jgi:hypothetical protein
MQTKHEISTTPTLGEAVAASYELGSAVASDRATAANLAARHLERVLGRGSNARLAIALADLARDLAPARPRAIRARNPNILFVSVQQIPAW